VVFSSEAYGDELARRLGARHVLVDAGRARVPVSASQIRARPLAYWDYLPPPVRLHYLRRVAVVGAESTGKTTLAQALAAHFNTVWVPEFAREYLLARGGVCTLADMPLIAQGQAASEDRLARQADRVLIGDTNLLTTQLWHEHYFGECPPALRRMAAERTADVYLLCDIDVPWVADELRDSPGQRAWFHNRFRDELDARGLPFIVLSGPLPSRLAPAVQAVEALLQRCA
jgi:NadR type nicotinamide-nucleotide adenylyltransferase